jgi:uncharacterized protein YbjT (DUF2867 family)
VIGMILVTGATGTIGSEVVERLVRRGAKVRAMTRNPSRATARPGVEVVQADFEDSASLVRAVLGVTTLFLLSAPAPALPRHDRAMLEAARSAGVDKVVKLSAIGTAEGFAEGTVGGWHRPGEEALRAGNWTWTLLRPSGFTSNALRWAEAIRGGHPVPNMTGDGVQGLVDPRDVAAVAVEALLSAEHAGRTYTLTGPALLSVPDQAAILARTLGRAVETVDVPPDTAREQLLASGVDSAFVDIALRGAELVRAGGNRILTDDVERVLGRPPGTFEGWAVDHRTVFLGEPAAGADR